MFIINELDNSKRSKETNLLWRVHKRQRKLNSIKNDDKTDFYHSLNEVMTFKECEIIFQLPKNTCVQDFKRGITKHNHVRKSGDTYLITKKEAIRLYEKYWTQRALRDQSHLYLSYDGKKMTQEEFNIRKHEFNYR